MESAQPVRALPVTQIQGDQRDLRLPVVNLPCTSGCAIFDLHVMHRQQTQRTGNLVGALSCSLAAVTVKLHTIAISNRYTTWC